MPADSRWSHLQAGARMASIGRRVDEAMVAIERDNPRLNVLISRDVRGGRPQLARCDNSIA